jgi:hypothetical protein
MALKIGKELDENGKFDRTEILEHEVGTKITGVVNTELCGPLRRREK